MCPRREVRDFLLALSHLDPIPLLAGFLPSPLHHFLKKRCLEYKRELESIRIEILVVVCGMMNFKLAISSRHATRIAENGAPKLNKINRIGKLKAVNNLVGSNDKDADHCDRLKRFRAPLHSDIDH